MDAVVRSAMKGLSGAARTIDQALEVGSIENAKEAAEASERQRMLMAALGRVDLPPGVARKIAG